MTRFGAVSLALVVLVSLAAVEAQEAKRGPRVGIVLGGPLASRQSQLDAFRQGMRDLGYIEGRSIIFEIRATLAR